MKMLFRRRQKESPKQIRGNAMLKALGFLGALLLGSFIGAGIMLLLAPKSGKRTRARIQHGYDELRDQLAEGMENAEEEVLAKARHFAADARGKVKELQQRRQAMFDGK